MLSLILLNLEENKMTSDQMYEIYERFIDEVVNKGWKGEKLGWTETVRCEVAEGTWYLFEHDSGFAIEFLEPVEGSDGEAFLKFWPEGNGEDEDGIIVESLEQLLELSN